MHICRTSLRFSMQQVLGVLRMRKFHKPHLPSCRPCAAPLRRFARAAAAGKNMLAASSLSQAAVAVTVTSFLVYCNSLWGGFVFDDHRAILTNDDLDPTKTDLWGVFVNDFWGGHMSRSESHKSYRPLTVLTYRYLNFWPSGLEPFSYHLVNVLLHCTSSLLFLLVCVRLLGRGWPSLYAALLFSVHSVHTESVSIACS